MIPSASDLARRRHTVIIVLRMLALVPAALTTLLMATGLANVLEWGIDESDAIAFAIILVFGGGSTAFTFFVLPRMVGLIVPRTRAVHCPFCDYRLEGLIEPRCPECGNALSPEFIGQPAAHGGHHDEPWPVTVERRRSLFAGVARALGLVFLMITLPIFVSLIGAAITVMSYAEDDAVIPLFIATFGIGPVLLAAGFGVARPERVARFIVPALKPDADRSQSPPRATGDAGEGMP